MPAGKQARPGGQQVSQSAGRQGSIWSCLELRRGSMQLSMHLKGAVERVCVCCCVCWQLAAGMING